MEERDACCAGPPLVTGALLESNKFVKLPTLKEKEEEPAVPDPPWAAYHMKHGIWKLRMHPPKWFHAVEHSAAHLQSDPASLAWVNPNVPTNRWNWVQGR